MGGGSGVLPPSGSRIKVTTAQGVRDVTRRQQSNLVAKKIDECPVCKEWEQHPRVRSVPRLWPHPVHQPHRVRYLTTFTPHCVQYLTTPTTNLALQEARQGKTMRGPVIKTRKFLPRRLFKQKLFNSQEEKSNLVDRNELTVISHLSVPCIAGHPNKMAVWNGSPSKPQTEAGSPPSIPLCHQEIMKQSQYYSQPGKISLYESKPVPVRSSNQTRESLKPVPRSLTTTKTYLKQEK